MLGLISATLRTIIFWVNVFAITAVCTFCIFVKRLTNPTISKLALSRYAHNIACLWGDLIIKTTPGWKTEIRGYEHLQEAKSKAVIIISNHESAADIFALFTTWLQFRWLSKASVFSLPMIGQSMQWAGYVPVERGNQNSHKEAMAQSRYWLEQNISMLFFPEGSRSKDGQLKPFKTGAFRLSVDTGIPILPVVIHGTRKMISKHSIVPNPANVVISALPAIQARDNEDIQSYMQRARELIKDELASLNHQGYQEENNLQCINS